MPTIIPVILSGGSGTRLWPVSRKTLPKQFLDLLGDGESLFQKTLTRLNDIADLQPPIVVCDREHRFIVAEQLQDIGVQPEAILLEPVAKNTAPAISSAAFYLANHDLADALMLVLPADHLIEDNAGFATTTKLASELVNTTDNNTLVTFGIKPTFPATGYGYIKTESNTSKVTAFIEKPDLETAKNYLQQGDYYWNSGMFLFKATQYLKELQQFEPQIYQHTEQAVAQAKKDLGFLVLATEAYQQCHNISIDYAVMEKSSNIDMVALDVDWNDIGSWSALWDAGEKDSNDNVSVGDTYLSNASNCYIHSENRLVTASHVEDLVIVETHDSVMVTTKDNAQSVKTLAIDLQNADREEATVHRKIFRPWGNYDCLDSGHRFQVKRILVKPGQSTSMQKHFHRAEHWIIVRGTAEVVCGEQTTILSENESIYIPLGHQHRIKNPGGIDLEFIEVQTGAYLGEDDIVRINDEYGRD